MALEAQAISVRDIACARLEKVRIFETVEVTIKSCLFEQRIVVMTLDQLSILITFDRNSLKSWNERRWIS